jgi:hypothetical protein
MPYLTTVGAVTAGMMHETIVVKVRLPVVETVASTSVVPKRHFTSESRVSIGRAWESVAVTGISPWTGELETSRETVTQEPVIQIPLPESHW